MYTVKTAYIYPWYQWPINKQATRYFMKLHHNLPDCLNASNPWAVTNFLVAPSFAQTLRDITMEPSIPE